MISRIGPALSPAYQEWLCQSGEAPIVDLALRLAADDRRLASLDVASGFAELWPDSAAFASRRKSSGDERAAGMTLVTVNPPTGCRS